jgi:hypothetical protein
MLLCVAARSPRRTLWVSVFVAVAIAAGCLVAPPAAAAGPRPSFQIPFRCGEKWDAFTRSGHRGIDWNFGTGSDDLGKPVTASAAGTAVRTYHYAYGYYVDVDHGGGWVTRYAHLLSDGRASGPVAQGETIGRVGSTGSSTAPHLHWEQRANDVPQSTLVADDKTVIADGRTHVSRNCLRRDPFLSGDVDGDGIDDLVVRFVGSDGSSSVKIVGGAATRELRPRQSLGLAASTLPATALLALGDTNGDGRADLNAAYRRNGGVQFVSFYGTSSGTFGSRRNRYFRDGWSFTRLKSIRSADVNGDRIDDITARFVADDGSSTVQTIHGAKAQELTVRRGKQMGASALPPAAATAMGDTNGDGRADLNAAFASGGRVKLVSFYGNSDGTFGPRRDRRTGDWKPRNLKALRVADVQDDGTDDFVLRFVRSDGGSTLRVVFGRRDRVLTRAGATKLGRSALPPAAHVATGDTNGDGRADFNVAFASESGVRLASFYGRRDPGFGVRHSRYVNGFWQFHRIC